MSIVFTRGQGTGTDTRRVRGGRARAAITPATIVSALVLLIAIAWALVPGLFTHFDPNDGGNTPALLAPSLEHWFGTDHYGRDIFARVIYGARITLLIGFGATAISALIGTAIGTTSAYLGGKADAVITRILDTWMAIPSLLVTLALIAGIGRGLPQTIAALAVGGIPGFSRILRAAALDVVNRDYMEAVRALGASRKRAVFKHVVPNVMSQVLIQATSSVSGNILLGATLSFLGLGAQPPAPEWGYMLAEGIDNYQFYSYLVSIPGLAIAITALAINILGDALRDALDPRLKK